MTRARGRPKSEAKGAAHAVRDVAAYLEAHRLSASTLALRLGMHPSSVTRALGQQQPRWTPSLRKICNAINQKTATRATEPLAGKAARRLERLLSSSEPAAEAVLAILDDVQQLVDLIGGRAAARSSGKRRGPRKATSGAT